MNWIFSKNQFVFAIFAILLTACSNDNLTLGVEIPSDLASVSLGEVLASPQNFHEKNVLLEGTISSQCPSLCDFTLQNGMHKTMIFPQGFELPKLNVGNSVRLYAQITSGEGNVIFSAVGLETKRSSE